MELKVPCACGQNFKFDVEPVNGTMPFNVNCPACGTDATAAANGVLSQTYSGSPAATAMPPAARLQINRPAESSPAMVAPAPRPIAPMAAPVKVVGEFNFGLGILGALLGAVLGVGLMFGFYEAAHFRFPLLGVGIGLLTGYGARLLGKGGDQTLGIISGAVALGSVVGALFLMYREFPPIFIISAIVSASFAYRIVLK